MPPHGALETGVRIRASLRKPDVSVSSESTPCSTCHFSQASGFARRMRLDALGFQPRDVTYACGSQDESEASPMAKSYLQLHLPAVPWGWTL